MKWNRRFRGLTMFVYSFGVEPLELSVKLGRLVIFDFPGSSLLWSLLFPNWQPKSNAFTAFSLLELFFSCCKMPDIVLIAGFQRIQMLRHQRLALDWLSVSFFVYWPIRMSGLLTSLHWINPLLHWINPPALNYLKTAFTLTNQNWVFFSFILLVLKQSSYAMHRFMC